METQTHPFTARGLGAAPFRLLGEIKQVLNASGERVTAEDSVGTWTTKPGGTCDYCGTYIVNMFRISSSDGNTFKVGSDCVAKISYAASLGDDATEAPIDEQIARERGANTSYDERE